MSFTRLIVLRSSPGVLIQTSGTTLSFQQRIEILREHLFLSFSDSQILPHELANQSVRIKEEQLRREEEKLREIELRVQREINEKRQELLAKEAALR